MTRLSLSNGERFTAAGAAVSPAAGVPPALLRLRARDADEAERGEVLAHAVLVDFDLLALEVRDGPALRVGRGEVEDDLASTELNRVVALLRDRERGWREKDDREQDRSSRRRDHDGSFLEESPYPQTPGAAIPDMNR